MYINSQNIDCLDFVECFTTRQFIPSAFKRHAIYVCQLISILYLCLSLCVKVLALFLNALAIPWSRGPQFLKTWFKLSRQCIEFEIITDTDNNRKKSIFFFKYQYNVQATQELQYLMQKWYVSSLMGIWILSSPIARWLVIF